MAHALVERRLAACVQISEIESVYRWQGQVHQDPECRLVIKTTRERYAQVEQAIRELHSYELPAIHALAFAAVSAPYAQWIVDMPNFQVTRKNGAVVVTSFKFSWR